MRQCTVYGENLTHYLQLSIFRKNQYAGVIELFQATSIPKL